MSLFLPIILNTNNMILWLLLLQVGYFRCCSCPAGCLLRIWDMMHSIDVRIYPFWKSKNSYIILTNICPTKSTFCVPWLDTLEWVDRRDDGPHKCYKPGTSSVDNSSPCRTPLHPCRCDLAMMQRQTQHLRRTQMSEIPPQTDLVYWCLWKLQKHEWKKQYGYWIIISIIIIIIIILLLLL